MDKSITLPPDEIFRNLENAKRFAIDIGNVARKYKRLTFSSISAFFPPAELLRRNPMLR